MVWDAALVTASQLREREQVRSLTTLNHVVRAFARPKFLKGASSRAKPPPESSPIWGFSAPSYAMAVCMRLGHWQFAAKLQPTLRRVIKNAQAFIGWPWR